MGAYYEVAQLFNIIPLIIIIIIIIIIITRRRRRRKRRRRRRNIIIINRSTGFQMDCMLKPGNDIVGQSYSVVGHSFEKSCILMASKTSPEWLRIMASFITIIVITVTVSRVLLLYKVLPSISVYCLSLPLLSVSGRFKLTKFAIIIAISSRLTLSRSKINIPDNMSPTTILVEDMVGCNTRISYVVLLSPRTFHSTH